MWNVLKVTAGIQRGTGDSVRGLSICVPHGARQATRGQCAGALNWLLRHPPIRFRLLIFCFLLA